MKKYEFIKLGQLVKIYKGKKEIEVNYKGEDVLRYIQIVDLRSDNNLKYTVGHKKNVQCTVNDVLIAWDGANAGTIGYGLRGAIGSTIAKLTPTGDIYIPFLGKFLQSKFRYLRSTCTGATIPHISRVVLLDLEIPLPPLEEQKKIASILDEADKLRQKDRALIAKYEELIQSLFLDMFGDPITNPMGWGKVKFSEVGKLDRGKSKHRPRNAPELLGGIYPLIQTGDVSQCKGYIKQYHATYSDIGLAQSRLWPKGTLCVTIAANIAKTGILMFDACFPDSIVGFIPNNKTNNEYIQFWLSFLQKTLEDSAPESAQKNINLAILRILEVPLPPLSLQQEFAKRVESIEKQKEIAEENLKKSEDLFNALLQKAFKGEL